MDSEAVTSEDIVRRGREILESDGWCQHVAHSGDGSHCTLGALALASQELLGDANGVFTAVTSYPGHRAADLIARQIEKDYGSWFSVTDDPEVRIPDSVRIHIPSWNDNSERTYEDVILTFKRAVEDDA